MAQTDSWRSIVASSLDWDQAHAKLDAAIEKMPAPLRGKRPERSPHSVWELLDHIRRVQRDLLEFCTNANYSEPHFPDDYWPPSPAPKSDAEWEECIGAIHADAAALAAFTTDSTRDLTAKIPHGTGQTYLRTVLVAVDHAAYHVGQIILTRHLLGAWPAK